MSFTKIMVHCVWGTKSRQPLLVQDKRGIVINYICQSALEKNICIDCINGHDDHLHALISLGARQNIADIMQHIKGGSSFWANNKSKLFSQKFEWADKYYAVSVSASQLDKVRNYIHGQEEHHKKVSFTEEYGVFMKRFGFGELG